MYYCIYICVWLHLQYSYVILLNICDISVHFFTISLVSFRAENNPDQWYQSRLLLIVFQCMSPTRSKYRKLGLELVSLEENRSRTPNKPSIAKEKKTTEQKILLVYFLSKLSHDRGKK